MKRLSLLVASIVTLVLFASAARPFAPQGKRNLEVSSASGSLVAGHVRARRTHDTEDVKRRLKQAEPGTYIGEILLTRDSALARWRDRVARPLRVWIQPTANIPDWDPGYVIQVRDAFATWSTTRIPVRFFFVADSASADVHVRFIDRFADPISGKTRWARDDSWWIVDADIVIALHHDTGESLDLSAIRAIALHEIGHMLGLDHTSDIANIMTPRVRVRELSVADRSTMELLYTLPPGPVR